MSVERFKDSNSLYKYELLDSYYRDHSIEKGRKFKKFFDEFCQLVFDINLTMLENKIDRVFPLVEGEKTAYSSISAAIHSLTPYHMSEVGRGTEEYDFLNKKRRSTDFWCMSKDKDFEVWIEDKYIGCYLNKDGWKIDAVNRVNTAYNQVLELHKIDNKQGIRIHKLALFNTIMYFRTKDYDKFYKDENIMKLLDDGPNQLAQELQALYDGLDSRTTRHIDGGLLLGVLDLRECLKKGKDKDILHVLVGGENKYVAPFYILAGVVLH